MHINDDDNDDRHLQIVGSDGKRNKQKQPPDCLYAHNKRRVTLMK